MSGRTVIAIILFVLAILAIVVGVIYVIEPMHSLPSFFPGHAKIGAGKHTKRGIAAIAVGVVLFVISFALAVASRREKSSYRY